MLFSKNKTFLELKHCFQIYLLLSKTEITQDYLIHFPAEALPRKSVRTSLELFHVPLGVLTFFFPPYYWKNIRKQLEMMEAESRKQIEEAH